MKRIMRIRRHRAEQAFNLIEVTLAVAIVAVGLIAILGLLPHGLEASRSTADDTLSATLVQDIFNDFRSQSFTNVLFGWNGTTYVFTNSLGTSGVVSNFYTANGFELGPQATTNRYFKVLITRAPGSALPLTKLTATVVFPAHVANPRNTNTFFTQIARYDTP